MRFWIDFSRILGRFGEALGELLAVLGGSGASPGGVCSQCFRQGGFRRVLESDLGGFWLQFGRFWASFCELLGRNFKVLGVMLGS